MRCMLQERVVIRLTSFSRSRLCWLPSTGHPNSGSCWKRSSKMILTSWSPQSASLTRPLGASPTAELSASRWQRKQCSDQLRSSLQWSSTTVTPIPRCSCAGAWIDQPLQHVSWNQAILSSFVRFLNPKNVTPVKPGEDIAGIHNFDIFVIQVGYWERKSKT